MLWVRIQKWCRRFFKEFRSYFVPSHIRTYRELTRKHSALPADTGRKFVCFDLTKAEMDLDSGRYLFALVSDFRTAGLQPCFIGNFRLLATMRYRPYKRELLDEHFCVCKSIDQLPPTAVEAIVTDRSRLPRNSALRVIRLRYEAVIPSSSQEVAMPYFVHPALYQQWSLMAAPDLNSIRPWRVFFAGAAHKHSYGINVLREKFGKMSRDEIFAALETGLPPDRIRRIRSAEDLNHVDGERPSFVWAGTGQYRIPKGDWLEVLRKADFFMACPGMGMPICHNLIEAMSAGVVPILEHPEYLDPPLQDGVNCVSFAGKTGLLEAFHRVFNMERDEIARLRRGAFIYHQTYHAPGGFARKLLESPHRRLDLFWMACSAPHQMSERRG